jgi:gliding motility-associated-like protein
MLCPGTVTSENLCPDNSSDNISVDLVGADMGCVNYSGLSVGTDTICLQVCNNFVCDTITMTITVEEAVLPPIQDTIVLDAMVCEGMTVCPDLTNLPGSGFILDTEIPGCLSASIFEYGDLENGCFEVTPTALGNELVCFAICNSMDSCLTFVLDITVGVRESQNISLEETIFLGDSDEYCAGIASMCPGTVTSENLCPDNSGENITLDLSNGDMGCLTYTGIELGVDTICLEVCNEFVCDTITLIITVEEPVIPVIQDTIIIDAFVCEVTSICPDLTFLPGSDFTLDTDIPGCDSASLFEYGDLENGCFDITPIALGNELVCFAVCNSMDSCLTYVMDITVSAQSPQSFTLADTIQVDGFGDYCADLASICPDPVSSRNYCPDDSGESISVDLNDAGQGCVNYTGLAIGTDTICFEVCNDFVCDSITLIVTVEEEDDMEVDGPPVLVSQCDFEIEDTITLTIDLLEDAVNVDDSTDVRFLTNTDFGSMFVDADFVITYKPVPGFCDRTEIIQYEVCNDFGCDTAEVCITILCDDLVVYTSVSPNDDGFNDVFFIEGIDQFPNNIVQIYNRWGNLIFNVEQYQNDWNGTYKDSKAVPDGTYFYVVTLNDGTGQVLSGFLELQR